MHIVDDGSFHERKSTFDKGLSIANHNWHVYAVSRGCIHSPTHNMKHIQASTHTMDKAQKRFRA